MPNEDIITALRNAMEHGDNLASAKQIMINSGYNPQEVEEASTFLGGGVIETHQTTPQEQLTMPNQKPSLISKINPFKKKQVPPISSPLTPQTQPIPAIQQPVPQAQPLQQTRPIPAIQQPIVAQAQPAPAIQQPVPQAQPLQQQPITAQP